MAVWGIGAYNPTTKEDYTEKFLSNKCAYVGYLPKRATTIFNMIHYIKPGDIIFVKSSQVNNMFIKAIGIVLDNNTETLYDKDSKERLGEAFPVVWKTKLKDDEESKFYRGREHITYFRTTLFEEYNTTIINYVIDKLLNPNPNEIIRP